MKTRAVFIDPLVCWKCETEFHFEDFANICPKCGRITDEYLKLEEVKE